MALRRRETDDSSIGLHHPFDAESIASPRVRRAQVTVALSFAAVLTAGAATAIVNARVLDTTDGPATATNRVLLPSTTTSTTSAPPPVTEAGRVSAAGGTVTAPTAPTPPVTASARPVTVPPAAETTAATTAAPTRATDSRATRSGSDVVEVVAGDAGAVTVEVTPNGLRVVGTRPAVGWEVEPLDATTSTTSVPGADGEPRHPTVRFRRSDGVWVEWELVLEDGRVVGRERDRRDRGEARDPGAGGRPTSPAPPARPTPTTRPAQAPAARPATSPSPGPRPAAPTPTTAKPTAPGNGNRTGGVPRIPADRRAAEPRRGGSGGWDSNRRWEDDRDGRGARGGDRDGRGGRRGPGWGDDD